MIPPTLKTISLRPVAAMAAPSDPGPLGASVSTAITLPPSPPWVEVQPGGEFQTGMFGPPAPVAATYARVDIVPDDEGTLRIMELELIEPALFLDHAPDAAVGFTNSVLRAAQTATA